MYCVVQARCGSKRLNRKIFKKIKNKSIIERVISRLEKSKKISKIIIATSVDKKDNDIEKFCKKKKISYYRGSLNNVALRFLQISKKYNLKSLIRISCDSPFINYKILDEGISFFKKNEFDIITNVFPRTYPKGLSYEIFKTSILKKNIKFFSNKDKEHVTTFFYKNFKNYKIYNFYSLKRFKNINLCVDTKKDLVFLRKNYNKILKLNFYEKN